LANFNWRAVERFHGKDFQDQPLTVNVARPKEERLPAARVATAWIAARNPDFYAGRGPADTDDRPPPANDGNRV